MPQPGVEFAAIHQQLHHSGKVGQDSYNQGKRNSLNQVQASLLRW